MNISKISRSIVVVIFIAVILCLTILDCTLNNVSIKITLFKVAFVIITIALILMYVYIKGKLFKLKINKKIALIYRYVYIILTVVLLRLVVLKNYYADYTSVYILASILLSVCIAITIKKIIFNVSKSDILSVLGTFAYASLPNIIDNKYICINSELICLFMCLSLLFLQKLIDELKQQGIKNNKYIILAIIVGMFSALSIVIGVNIWVYLITYFMLLFITCNLDSTHIKFSNKIINRVNLNSKDKLYKIERINISKLFISIVIIVATSFILSFLINLVIVHINTNELINTLLNNRVSFLYQFKFINTDISKTSILKNMRIFLSTSRTYYLVILIYILIIEILTIALKRKYDTKSTIIKSIFINTLLLYCIFNLNIYMYQPIFSILLILIAIVNTSNLYLNREERIKLLTAKF